eukprot:scaffold30_cov255-Pinguiococcus_pyrenoidosus.AAC.20
MVLRGEQQRRIRTAHDGVPPALHVLLAAQVELFQFAAGVLQVPSCWRACVRRHPQQHRARWPPTSRAPRSASCPACRSDLEDAS